ncbi:Imm64 family immunity protein [Bacillus sp. PS06]|uniref:Imm64 family immunity protein n=1 Tax=Bacillus sp. PS06 TaxID=2764176 RepID=UPI0017803303|nr:Imm64 family immunity protein [Bacillus sp. PS06]MBD8070170.1 hypothetical protein [Bacillus sp. PS06]
MSQGGYINIGIVFSNEQEYVRVFESIVEFVVKKGSHFSHVKYSKDIDGTIWIEQQIKNNVIEMECLSGYYIGFTLSGEFLNLNFSKIGLVITKETGYFGFLLEINWSDVSSDNLITTQRNIENQLIDLYKALSYEYAFVGHEIEIEIHPADYEAFIVNNESYPVGIIGRDKCVDIYYGTSGIDGLTVQEQGKKTIHV